MRLWFWLIPIITAAIGGILRFVRLEVPRSLVFDETYYVKDGYSLLVSGYERSWPDKANDAFIAGNPGVLLSSPEYVVHPPVGQMDDRGRHVAVRPGQSLRLAVQRGADRHPVHPACLP